MPRRSACAESMVWARSPAGLQGGVTNRIVPLEPPVFLELLGVTDPAQPDGRGSRTASPARTG
jgi:hypothetical protein